jgi:iron complex transport system ATP-binding protein
MTNVVVLHDFNMAAQYADRIVAMKRGRVVHYGGTEEVITGEILSDLYEIPAYVEGMDAQRVILWGAPR